MSLTPAGTALARRVTHPLLFPLWMLGKLPAAWFVGIRVKELSGERCVTTLPYGWRSTNPYRSTYFAAQAMAAELSTGALVLLAAAETGRSFSTLVVDMEGSFSRKASALLTFTCEGGAEALQACRESAERGEARTLTLETVGRLPDGSEASRFQFRWSVKARGGR